MTSETRSSQTTGAHRYFRYDLLKGRNALVLGGTSGIGMTVAAALYDHGADVAILGKNEEKAHQAAAALSREAQTPVTAYVADVRRFFDLETAFNRFFEDRGLIDILVFAVGANSLAQTTQMSPALFKTVLETDLLGMFYAVRAAYRFVRAPGASIIAISATQAFTPTPMQGHVCAAKAGMDMLVKTLALESGGDGVRVNSIAAGATTETIGFDRLVPNPEFAERFRKAIPLERFGSKEDVANLALFLASAASSYVTGSVFTCDGGQSLGATTVMMDEFRRAYRQPSPNRSSEPQESDAE